MVGIKIACSRCLYETSGYNGHKPEANCRIPVNLAKVNLFEQSITPLQGIAGYRWRSRRNYWFFPAKDLLYVPIDHL
jgi:hypothetical protein